MRYTVLTYIFDGYEHVHEIGEKDPDAEYILVTDDPSLMSKTWKVVVDEELLKLSPFNKCYRVRFIPFHYGNTDIVVRIDGSITVKSSLRPIVDAFIQGGYDRCLMIHPERNTMPVEYREWVRSRGYPQKQADKCLAMMKRMGYDFAYKGLYQGCFEILRNNFVNLNLNAMTFGLLRYLGEDEQHIERIDQTVFSFAANLLFSDELKVMPVSEMIVTHSKYMQWNFHKRNIPITKYPKIEPFLFNKPVKPIL